MGELRYTDKPFPAYRYLPGSQPHPTRDPAGHSYQGRSVSRRRAPWRAEDWRDLDDWLYGVDLFNAQYYWEAHEAWEGPWAATDRSSAPALFLQGLIQVSAALLKVRLGSAAGARSLSRDGLQKLRHVKTALGGEMMGLDLDVAIGQLESFFACLEDGELPDVAAAPRLRLAK